MTLLRNYNERSVCFEVFTYIGVNVGNRSKLVNKLYTESEVL